jgi:ABC-type lipoprotein export system ATPase subunit
MGGLDRPTSGQVLYRGRDFYALGDRERSAIRAQKSVSFSRPTTCFRS